MKVTIHPGSAAGVPDLVRALIAAGADPGGLLVRSVGAPGVTVDAATAVRFLTGAIPAERPLAAAGSRAGAGAVQAVSEPDPPKPAAAPAAPHVAATVAQAEATAGLRQPRKPGRPRKTTTRTASEG